MNKAIIHEWLVNYAGSERCVESFTNLWPDAPVYALVDYLNDEERRIILKGKKAHTSFIQKMPFSKNAHRQYLSLFPLAVEQFDLSNYDVVISSSHAVAKGVLTNAYQLHICYCHTPMRYAWDLYHQYLNEAGLNKGVKGRIAKRILHKMRIWDVVSSNRVDFFVANSNHIAKRIKKIYNRDADVIYPPVDVHLFEAETSKDNYFVTASRMVPYKRMDMIVEAFSKMPDKKLIVIGDGSEMKKIKEKASSNIEILGYRPFNELKEYMKKARAFVFAAEEDFGIIPVEAMACGTPVIAFGKGGALETVKEGVSGSLFFEQSPGEIKKAVLQFEKKESSFDYNKIKEHSLQFSRQRFESEISTYVKSKSEKFFQK